MFDLTFDDLCGKLANRENFSFARYGDGEWAAILGRDGANCDGHKYYPEMSLSLASCLLREQGYHFGMQPKALRDMGHEIHQWIAANDCEREWCDADILHDASTNDELNEMWKAMRGRRVVLAGPKHLKPLAARMQAAYVFVPDRNCWKWLTTIYTDVIEELDKDAVVLWCASMATEVMIDKAFREYGDTITQIDAGSVFDPYCGVKSRRYHAGIIERIQA